MFLKQLSLQHFRSYPKARFDFDTNTTVIIGSNTAGKSNLMEAIYLLASGKSFRADKQAMMIHFGKEMARVKGLLKGTEETRETKGTSELEVMLTVGQVAGVKAPLVKHLVNGVSKRRVDFAGILSVVMFSPSDLDIIVGTPSLRRRFLDEVLEQVSLDYRQAFLQYTKGLRQRNALLEHMRESGQRQERQLSYWNDVLISYGNVITKEREAFLTFVNETEKPLFSLQTGYSHSKISAERLEQYSREEVAAGVTLVGPHRDDFIIHMRNGEEADIRFFGSRGQQRLAILQLKMLQMDYITKHLGDRPLLLLDDIFSELDDEHIKHVLDVVGRQQTIMTTTHKEFVSKSQLKQMQIVELGK